MRRLFLLFAVLAGLGTPTLAAAGEKSDTTLGRRVPPFVLPNTAGKLDGLSDFKDSSYLVVVFLGTKCPVANAYVPILLDLQKRYREKKLQIIGVTANPSDTPDAV